MTSRSKWTIQLGRGMGEKQILILISFCIWFEQLCVVWQMLWRGLKLCRHRCLISAQIASASLLRSSAHTQNPAAAAAAACLSSLRSPPPRPPRPPRPPLPLTYFLTLWMKDEVAGSMRSGSNSISVLPPFFLSFLPLSPSQLSLSAQTLQRYGSRFLTLLDISWFKVSAYI